MYRRLLRSKIHKATITSADLYYQGSLTLDPDLMKAADLIEHEEVQIVNINNGNRFTTYVIAGEAGSGTVQLNGAGARMGHPGDLIIIMCFGEYSEGEIAGHKPTIVFVDRDNEPYESEDVDVEPKGLLFSF